VKVLKTVFAALHENDSETFSKKLKRIKTKIFIPKTSYENQATVAWHSLRGHARPASQQPDRADDKDAQHHDMAAQKFEALSTTCASPCCTVAPCSAIPGA
jgi:hypothetical protein